MEFRIDRNNIAAIYGLDPLSLLILRKQAKVESFGPEVNELISTLEKKNIIVSIGVQNKHASVWLMECNAVTKPGWDLMKFYSSVPCFRVHLAFDKEDDSKYSFYVERKILVPGEYKLYNVAQLRGVVRVNIDLALFAGRTLLLFFFANHSNLTVF